MSKEERSTQPMELAAEPVPTSSALLSPFLQFPIASTVISQNKTYESLELIKMALVNSELFKNVESFCIDHIAEKMEWEEYIEGEIIIQETSPGGKLYVVEYGLVQVSRNGAPLCYLSPGKLFGELALLFKWQHTVTFKAASSPCQLWTLGGDTLDQILKHGWKRHAYVQFMTSLPLFNHLPENRLIRLSWQIGEQEYMHGEYIIRQGTHATKFFVIRRGRVKVTIKESEDYEKFVRVMHQGDFFGEKALLSQQKLNQKTHQKVDVAGSEGTNTVATTAAPTSMGVRTANVIVDDEDGVTCLVIDREAFYQFFWGLEQQVARRYVND